LSQCTRLTDGRTELSSLDRVCIPCSAAIKRIKRSDMVTFLANTFTLTICHRPSVCLSSVCHLSVTFMHFTQAIEIFGYVLRHLVRWPSPNIQVKFYGGVKHKRFWTSNAISRKRCKIGAKLVLITNRKTHYELLIGTKFGDLG